MLTVLGFAMILTFMTLVMTKRVMPLILIILVPIVFALIAGAGLGFGDMAIEALARLAPTAGLLLFAIIFFGTMIDTGLFDPLIRLIIRFSGRDPMRLVVGTALLTTVISLDGDGATTFIIVTSAFLPIYRRLGISPWVLTVVATCANGVLNNMPWGGAIPRASASLGVDPMDIFWPMAPSIGAGVVAVVVLAWILGVRERSRIGALQIRDRQSAGLASASAFAGGGSHSLTSDIRLPDRPRERPRLIWVNLALTIAAMVVITLEAFPPIVVFMIATALALIINFRTVTEQVDQFEAHAPSVIGVMGMIFAASMLTGVLNGTGMVDSMGASLADAMPEWMGPHMALVAGLLSVPLCFLITNDGFFFGVLPVLTEVASEHGISAVEMARAALVGQTLAVSSPLVASFLLLMGLSGVSIGEHLRRVLWRGALVAVVMLLVGGIFGAYPL